MKIAGYIVGSLTAIGICLFCDDLKVISETWHKWMLGGSLGIFLPFSGYAVGKILKG